MLAFASLLTFSLLAGVIQNQVVYAQDSGEENAETLEDQCAKTQEDELDALLCKAILELQIKVADLEAGVSGVQEEDVSEEDVTEEEPSEDIVEEEVIEEVPEEESVDSPLTQIMSGVNPDQVQCKSGQALIFKASNSHPTCVNASSFNVLISRGWIASYDPSLDVVMEEEITNGGTEAAAEEAKGQDYTADLSESVEMGAN